MSKLTAKEQKLVEAHLPMAQKIAASFFRGRGGHDDEYFGHASLALCEAALKLRRYPEHPNPGAFLNVAVTRQLISLYRTRVKRTRRGLIGGTDFDFDMLVSRPADEVPDADIKIWLDATIGAAA
jgi:hypothetical protein